MHRTRGFIATAVLGTALLTASPASAGVPPVVISDQPLIDLAPTSGDPTDGAHGRFYAVGVDGRTTAVLFVSGLDPSSAGRRMGAHVHVKACDDDKAGGHYKTPGTDVPADAEHEVWLDFTILPGGFGFARADVPFEIPSGAAHAVVIHERGTGPGGVAGTKLACLPVEF